MSKIDYVFKAILDFFKENQIGDADVPRVQIFQKLGSKAFQALGLKVFDLVLLPDTKYGCQERKRHELLQIINSALLSGIVLPSVMIQQSM